MNRNISRTEQVRAALRRLEQYCTLSPFSRLFYRLIYDLLRSGEGDAVKLGQAFHVFLRCECRRHDTALRMVRDGRLDPLDIVRLSRLAHDRMGSLRMAIEATEVSAARDRFVRELLLAECEYLLGRTEEVVMRLQRALGAGGRHPLVHFALGYNMYALAVQRFTRAGPNKGEVVATDPEAFQQACRDAIDAFEGGLGDPVYDAQIHWWIGMLWEMLGEKDQAVRHYRSAMAIDPSFVPQAMQKLRCFGVIGAVERTLEEAERLGRLGPITDAEMACAHERLSGTGPLPWLFGEA
jgi:tetratricopeptide (TPR) repeat protein